MTDDKIHQLELRIVKLEAARNTWGHLVTTGIALLAAVAALGTSYLSPSPTEKPGVIYVQEDEVARPVKVKKEDGETFQAKAYGLADGTTVVNTPEGRLFVRDGHYRRPDGTEAKIEIVQQ
ncbi:MAG: hypothetical protein ACPGVG_15785 [Mycobacterium sp.]